MPCQPAFASRSGGTEPEVGHLQQHVDDGRQRNRAEDRQRNAAPRVSRLAGQVHRTLETVEAEHDACGGDGGKHGGEIDDMRAAIDADLEVLAMEAARDEQRRQSAPVRPV